ncbi:MAG TPA: hypothetical protein VK821_10305 [Dehalococcoidia bacterium]|nr:hypothetical protein [Dehalococcoidia bacterium]
MTVREESAITQRSQAPMCFGPEHHPRMLVPVDCSEFGEANLGHGSLYSAADAG